MSLARTIGRWGLTALVINSIIGSGIFGMPSELTRLLGASSLRAVPLAGFLVGSIMLSTAEVARQFSEPGGAYLYARTAFGAFAGIQVGWFSLLAPISAGAALANLFVNYLGGLLPGVVDGWARMAIITVVIGVLAAFNILGVGSGTILSGLLTIAKLLPLVMLIVVGAVRISSNLTQVPLQATASASIGSWLTAFVLLVYSYGGFENAVVPGSEIKEPRRNIPLSLGVGLLACVVLYTALQYLTLRTIGMRYSSRPLAEVAASLIGPQGALVVDVAILLSTLGFLSAGMLNTPRLAYAFAVNGDFPKALAKVHSHFKTPFLAISLYGGCVWLLAVTGTFLWMAVLTTGSVLVAYIGTCASLIRLRQVENDRNNRLIPLAPLWATIGILVSLTLLTRLNSQQFLVMGVTSLMATVNWWWANNQRKGIGKLTA